MERLYYTAPSDEIFDEVKKEVIAVWESLGAEPAYTEEKVGLIKAITNISDNMMYMIAMFDQGNIAKLADRLSAEARTAIRDRMIDGGNPEFLIPF